ncbi:MAG: response regulator transcription factor [Cyanobacteria bacterium REEB65]|nr:response regulator transcription factor [Cyanobacteria bacterium REEB65]
MTREGYAMILVISRDDALISRTASFCIREGDRLRVAPNVPIARTVLPRESGLRAMILDLDASGREGFSLCRSLVDTTGAVVFIASSGSSALDKYESYASGACEYLDKPVDPEEFACRLRARLARRGLLRHSRPLKLGEVEIDLDASEVRIGDRRRQLTPHETAILRHLAARPGQCIPTEELLVEALGYPPRLGNPEVVRTHIRHLREKLEPDPSRPRWLVNVPRVGYRITGIAS